MNSSAIIENQRSYVAGGQTLPPASRSRLLSRLHATVKGHQRELLQALARDLGKGEVDAYMTEVGYVLSEIEYARKHLRTWMKKSGAATVPVNRPGRSYHFARPFGSALVIGPWNYPFGLTFAPLAAALAAGNCAVVKPSEFAPATGACITNMIASSFDPAEIAVINGGPAETEALIAAGVDIIFFTGGTATGKKIMRAASDTLTPVVLELGGKNPCIVDRTASLDEAARRIVWGKFLNAGQTCMAPDFVCVHEDVADRLHLRIIDAVNVLYGEDPRTSPAYGRIINEHHLTRLTALLEGARVVHGGTVLPGERYIGPTVIEANSWDTPLMREEIFGPLLPIITYRDTAALLDVLRNRPSPLAWYCFTTDNKFKHTVERRARCGTICFNGTVHALITRELPFGGIGASGMGRYHGRAGFDAFSSTCGVLDKHPRREFTRLYPPYTSSVALLEKIRRFFM